ncbi:SWIM zinc finger domain-containing protein [Paenibacillus sp. N1-5-1-14]|uniref:SWIM zinc finger family protein n=1 Tax=Paenibacillus radicibacter TaxID=2972488 RepID=UPI002158F369|nr:SWIM zinc finger family protein [Paenibacillus radicibacter]MCR8644548.1 SWIM zinc finger domain-containing protein [Paenibacillus radicibacter]
MSQLIIAEEKLEQTADAIRANYNMIILLRGLEYHVKKAVMHMTLIHKGSALRAVVRGTDRYEVVLDLEQFEESTCECRYDDGYCKHIAAVFLTAYALQGKRPEQFVQTFKQAQAGGASRLSTRESSPNKAKIRMAQADEEVDYVMEDFLQDGGTVIGSGQKASKSTASTRVDRETEELQPAHLAIPVPQETDRPDQWHAYYGMRCGGYLKRDGNVQSFYSEVTKELLPLAANWQPDLRSIYELHVLLFIESEIQRSFLRLGRNAHTYNSYYYQNIYELAADQTERAIVNLVNELDIERALTNHSDYIQPIADVLAEHTFTIDRSPVDWLNLYRFLWGNVLLRRAWGEAEIARLEEQRSKYASDRTLSEKYGLALAHFEFMNGEDEKAIERLEPFTHSDKIFTHIWPYLQSHLSQEQWEKLSLWLEYVAQFVERSYGKDWEMFCSYWHKAVENVPDKGKLEAIMLSLHPRSFLFYTGYLTDEERWQDWVDVHLYHGVSPLQADKFTLKAIEKAEPSLLLPMYFQTVEICISLKNRDAYRLAVRMLKKTRTIHKKLKQEHKLQPYVDYLTKQHSRLRAFQEELRKGGFIS